MSRSLEIARRVDKTLHRILGQQSVVFNGKRLRGFDAVIRELSAHPELAKIDPTVLTEIHGDLSSRTRAAVWCCFASLPGHRPTGSRRGDRVPLI